MRELVSPHFKSIKDYKLISILSTLVMNRTLTRKKFEVVMGPGPEPDF